MANYLLNFVTDLRVFEIPFKTHNLHFQDEEEALNEVGYDDVGGCRKQLALIKEVSMSANTSQNVFLLLIQCQFCIEFKI